MTHDYLAPHSDVMPAWLGDEALHVSHRAKLVAHEAMVIVNGNGNGKW